jgi:hypothetical protein
VAIETGRPVTRPVLFVSIVDRVNSSLTGGACMGLNERLFCFG